MTDDPQETQHESFRLPTNKEVPVWRYMDLAKYLMMLNSKSLYFARANKLGDPFEGSSTRAMVARREHIRANRTTDPNLAGWKDDEIFTNLAKFYKTAWPTHALEVIADIAEHEIDLIEIGKMVDDFGPVLCGGTGSLRRRSYRSPECP
jgi:hypothetical protein